MFPFKELNDEYFIVKPSKRINVDNIEQLIGRKFSIWTSSYLKLNYEEKLKVYRYILNLFEYQSECLDREEKSFLTYGNCRDSGKFDNYKMSRLNTCKDNMSKYLPASDMENVDLLLNNLYGYSDFDVKDDIGKVYLDEDTEEKIPHARVGKQNSKQKFVVISLLTSLFGILFYKWRK